MRFAQKASRSRHFIEGLKARIYAVIDPALRAEEEQLRKDISTPWPPASAPGQPPHRRTGRLHTGIMKFTGIHGNSVRGIMVSQRPGGDPAVPSYLEHGTNRMAARPYMRRSFERVRAVVHDQIMNVLRHP